MWHIPIFRISLRIIHCVITRSRIDFVVGKDGELCPLSLRKDKTYENGKRVEWHRVWQCWRRCFESDLNFIVMATYDGRVKIWIALLWNIFSFCCSFEVTNESFVCAWFVRNKGGKMLDGGNMCLLDFLPCCAASVERSLPSTSAVCLWESFVLLRTPFCWISNSIFYWSFNWFPSSIEPLIWAQLQVNWFTFNLLLRNISSRLKVADQKLNVLNWLRFRETIRSALSLNVLCSNCFITKSNFCTVDWFSQF